MTTTTSQLEEIEQLAQDAVQIVFETMLSLQAVPSDEAFDRPEGADIIGSVGFIGKITGSVFLCSNLALAKFVAERMLGISPEETDDDWMLNDAFGELGNMIVGHVKSRLCDMGHSCTLTIPSIVRGQRLTVEQAAGVSSVALQFTCMNFQFVVEIHVKETE